MCVCVCVSETRELLDRLRSVASSLRVFSITHICHCIDAIKISPLSTGIGNLSCLHGKQTHKRKYKWSVWNSFLFVAGVKNISETNNRILSSHSGVWLSVSRIFTTNTYIVREGYPNTGLFISPSGISELDCATTKSDTAERSISIGRESLQVFFLY